MTYPRCPVLPHDALEQLRKVFPHVAIKDWIVAPEVHADGTPHLHAFIRYEDRVTWSSTRWDLRQGDLVYHGNYQVAKSWKAVMDYCKKDGNHISNISIEDAKSKKAARNQQLLNEDPQQLIQEGTIGVLQLPALLKSKAAYTTLAPSLQTLDVRGIWIVGPTGAGKSHYVRTKHPTTDLYIKSQNKWWDGYCAQSYVLLDDFDHSGQCLGHLLKIWADKWSCTGEIKGGHVNLHHITFYVTSQYEIDVIWPGDDNKELRDAINRRFRRVGLSKSMDTEEEFFREDGPGIL